MKVKCPICNGKFMRKKVPYSYVGIDFGLFIADECQKCGEVFFTEKSSDAIEKKAKELGIWGLSARTRIGYSGNSLIVRVNKNIANFMHLKVGEEVMIRPEGKKKLVVEVE